jgi:hypothetical protein
MASDPVTELVEYTPFRFRRSNRTIEWDKLPELVGDLDHKVDWVALNLKTEPTSAANLLAQLNIDIVDVLAHNNLTGVRVSVAEKFKGIQSVMTRDLLAICAPFLPADPFKDVNIDISGCYAMQHYADFGQAEMLVAAYGLVSFPMNTPNLLYYLFAPAKISDPHIKACFMSTLSDSFKVFQFYLYILRHLPNYEALKDEMLKFHEKSFKILSKKSLEYHHKNLKFFKDWSAHMAKNRKPGEKMSIGDPKLMTEVILRFNIFYGLLAKRTMSLIQNIERVIMKALHFDQSIFNVLHSSPLIPSPEMVFIDQELQSCLYRNYLATLSFFNTYLTKFESMKSQKYIKAVHEMFPEFFVGAFALNRPFYPRFGLELIQTYDGFDEKTKLESEVPEAEPKPTEAKADEPTEVKTDEPTEVKKEEPIEVKKEQSTEKEEPIEPTLEANMKLVAEQKYSSVDPTIIADTMKPLLVKTETDGLDIDEELLEVFHNDLRNVVKKLEDFTYWTTPDVIDDSMQMYLCSFSDICRQIITKGECTAVIFAPTPSSGEPVTELSSAATEMIELTKRVVFALSEIKVTKKEYAEVFCELVNVWITFMGVFDNEQYNKRRAAFLENKNVCELKITTL